MPGSRGTVTLCDEVDLLGDALISLIEVAELVTSDGMIEPGEHQLLRAHHQEVMTHFRRLPARVSEIDNVMRVIGCAAHAGRISKKVLEVTREAHRDAQALAAA